MQIWVNRLEDVKVVTGKGSVAYFVKNRQWFPNYLQSFVVLSFWNGPRRDVFVEHSVRSFWRPRGIDNLHGSRHHVDICSGMVWLIMIKIAVHVYKFSRIVLICIRSRF